jgi:4-aminobutyrate aminotransferase-like enzyme/Ser/Thr protein kinase RdoA (MazF antagonist)
MSRSFNFFEQEALPAPELSAADARLLVLQRYGIEGSATELGSQQDANFLIDALSGRYVLKVSNPVFSPAEIAAQDLVAAHLAACEPDLRIPEAVRGVDGATIQPVSLDGRSTVMRLVTFVEGEVLSASRYLAPAIVESLGALVGRTSRALATFDGSIPARALQWDVRYAGEVVSRLSNFVAVAGGIKAVRSAAESADEILAPYRDRLAVQAIHGDLTDDNVIATVDSAGRRRPVGLIDFGDLTESWAIAELAVMCSSLLPHAGDDLTTILPAIRAFDRVRPISDDELYALWPLVVLRAAALMVSGQHQAHIDRGNQYAAKNLGREWRIFERSVSVPMEVMTELIRSSLRPHERRAPVHGGRVLSSGGADTQLVALDFSTTSPRMHGGTFLAERVESRLAADTLEQQEAGAVYVPFRQPRLTRTALNSFTAPATVGVGVEVFANEPLDIHAPWAGVVELHDDAVALRGAGNETLWLTGTVFDVSHDDVLAVGERIGRLAADGRTGSLRLQVSYGPERPPFFVSAAMAQAWASVCPDPTSLVVPGAVQDADPAAADTLLNRRNASLASVQEHYFLEPPEIERGWRNHLFDVDGRSYVDMLNNVSIIGHGHPRLADAIDQQWRLLNTNSRFHYRAVVEFSERLAAQLPDSLDAVFLVNSGTEADDLALRLAWANTGRRDVVVVREAYHGWSDATDAISTSVADNPNALDSRPSWVHTVAAPNTFRGQYRGDEAFRYAEDAVAHIDDMARAGRPPAAFLAEPFYGNAGGMPLPDGYLTQVYKATRRVGGLCIADEVQAGYGRLGEHFWGFEQQGVVPDIVTVAKAMGNGHPLGAVITTKAIAEGYRSQGYFFSSAGGSPVSCVAGLAVLDVLRDERLQANAREVGNHLRRRLLALADRHTIIGAVHGMGLYLGVEMVRDRVTLEPAREETAAICERLRELGVIMQPTSDRMCVLKIKPPLGIGVAEADFFADALDRVLTDGW